MQHAEPVHFKLGNRDRHLTQTAARDQLSDVGDDAEDRGHSRLPIPQGARSAVLSTYCAAKSLIVADKGGQCRKFGTDK